MTTNTTTTPAHKLLTKEVLEFALKNDLGEEWTLENFEIKDFTKKGDNYATVVTSVICKGVLSEKKQETCYVAKLNPLREFSSTDEMTNEMFIKEGLFLTEIAPKLNTILRNVSYPSINFPECVFYDSTKGKEVLISKDLRCEGYKMLDRRVGMELGHCVMLVKGLARLHASSVILKQELQEQIIPDVYPFLYNKWLNRDGPGKEMLDGYINDSINISLRLLGQVKGYDKQKQWLEDIKNESTEIYHKMLMEYSPDNMKVIRHGDCWNNNVMFRYNVDGNPAEVTLLDLQLCQYNSLALDLNYFLYTSVTGETRQKYCNHLLSVYFQEFGDVLKAGNMEMPFTEDELKKEVLNKTMFGFLSALMIVPMIVCESEVVPDFNVVTDDTMEDFMKDFGDTLVNTIGTEPIYRTRFLSLFEDILQKLKVN